MRGFGLGTAIAQAIEQMKSLRLVTEGDDGPPRLDISGLIDSSTLQDQEVGICAIPIHGFSGDEMEIVSAGREEESIANILRERQVLQYFYPAPDQLALGLIHQKPEPVSRLLEQLDAVPRLGHPYGPNELTEVGPAAIVELVEQLREMGLTAEGNLGVELTPDGKSVRASIRFQPRDGLVARVMNHLNINFNIGGG